ncbi:MAG: class II aldolase/adducin family protein [Deltaproteobacteria bacterium]|nr:class II aldolase/adducin family protein [Deltaproteobacteria bacterium]
MNSEIQKVKEEILAAAKRAYQIGLQTGNGGNLSARVPGTDKIIIKASGYSFGECTTENLVTVNLKGEVLGEGNKPSREIRTHLAIYNHREDIYGIFHCHSPWAIACAEEATEIRPITVHGKAKIGSIPVLRVLGHADEAVEKGVLEMLRANPALSAFIQTRHGIFTLAKTITLAEHHAELVEEIVQIELLAALRQFLARNLKEER